MAQRLRSTVRVTSQRMLADGITPVAAFAALRRVCAGPAFLFESAPGAGHAARHSIIGLGAHGELVARDGQVGMRIAGAPVHVSDRSHHALQAARQLLERLSPAKPSPFLGAYGAAAFEFAGYLERLPAVARGGDPMPDLHLIVPEVLAVFDHVTHEVEISAFAGADAVQRVKQHMLDARLAPLQTMTQRASLSPQRLELPYASAVARAKSAIRAGEAFQVVLSQRWTTPVAAAPFDVYRALRSINPSPYMFFLDFGWGELLGSSPELLVGLSRGRARLRPLAGTRARSADAGADAQLERELRRDAKELAEHVMLVDLGRNDLARACVHGSVRIDELLSVERYSHVMHLVSEVTGLLRDGCDAFDLFSAAFPAGTVSGAPKIRAIELIAQLEGRRRGFYAGSVCRFGFDGSLDACITLRSTHAYSGRYHLAAGSGIVDASRAARENLECRAKADAVAVAIGAVPTTDHVRSVA